MAQRGDLNGAMKEMRLKELFSLKKKTAIVTGGGRGLGAFICEGLAEAGADLVIASRKLENCEKLCDELEMFQVRCLPVKCDMSSEHDINNLVDAAMDAFGTIDILVNNAGITWAAPTLEYPIEKWDRIFAVNIRGAWILTQKVANIMENKGGGKIINISSIAASRGLPEEGTPTVAYNSSKAALEILTKNLAVKLGQYNIHVNCIAPGFFRTDMVDHIFTPEMKPTLEHLISEIPLGIYGEADHIKGLAVFLASRASDYMSGAVIPLDGGSGAR